MEAKDTRYRFRECPLCEGKGKITDNSLETNYWYQNISFQDRGQKVVDFVVKHGFQGKNNWVLLADEEWQAFLKSEGLEG